MQKKKIKLIKLHSSINTASVARHTLSLFLAISNNIVYSDRISKNKWIRKKNFSPEKTKIGIVGLGNVGKIFARYLDVLKFKVNYYSRKNKKNNYKYFKSLRNLIIASDVVSIHLKSNSQTRKIFNKKTIKLLKNKVLINTSRGDLLDEKLLYFMLKKKIISQAALDVFKFEPTISISKKIRNLNNVISTCHSSFYDEETIKKMVFTSLNKIIEKLK